MQNIDSKNATQQGDIPVRIIKENKFTFSKVLSEMFNFYVDNNTFPNGLNDTQREKLCFTQFSKIMAAWLLLTFFTCLHNQLSSIHSIITN